MPIEYIGDIAVVHGGSLPNVARLVVHGAVEGQYRCPSLSHCRGPRHLSLRAVHTELHKIFVVDVGQVYFNVRLGGFRRLLTSCITDTHVTVIGQGVGILSLLLYKKGRTVVGIQSNIRAHRLAALNRDLNHAIRYYPLWAYFPAPHAVALGCVVYAMPSLFLAKLSELPIGHECYAFSFAQESRLTFMLKFLALFLRSSVQILAVRSVSPQILIVLLHIEKVSCIATLDAWK